MNAKRANQILMLDTDASFDDIRYAYRKLVLDLHPDKNKNEAKGEKFKIVSEAYHYLKKQHKQKNSKYQNTRKQQKNNYNEHNSEGDWSKFTKDFETNQEFWNQYEKAFWDDYKLNADKKSDTNHFKNPFWDEVKQNINSKSEKTDFKKQHNTHAHNLFVEIDKSLCIGCCSCETIAPNVFSVDKLKHINPKSNVHNLHGANEEKIMDAAETCPTKAILVDEKNSGKRIFPR
ncbi:Chaperone protein DnaJ 1 [Marine Group I thaumarchaeote SCGC AAA799-O18]|jgi:DnaJ-class molecular chaperone|nr:Chaperone protein DnaJ 1 [Marine Group I thaumarchaeote SCGC AAA799-O18]